MSYNPFTLKNKTILVTGASSGIGKSIAIECSKMGANIIVTARNGERLLDTFKQLETSTANAFYSCDLTNEESRQKLIGQLPELDGIVHCAGIINRKPLKYIKEKTLEELMGINFFSPALLTQNLFKNKLLKTKSSIVFISSIASSFASYGNIMYMASKGAINSLSKGLAFELAQLNIRVNVIQPGMVQTNLTNALSSDEIESDIKRYPLGRYGKPEEIAFAAIYLLSDASEWMTGSTIKIDGGITLR